MSKKRTVFACNQKELYVELKAIMWPMLAMIDGIGITFFGKGKKPYLKIDTAIQWLEKELTHNPTYPNGKSQGREMLQALKEAKEKFNQGNIIEQ
jgi:hypothetical protein